ncbi:Sarcosine dehydrogenase [hydrothermal vent metagenome]|uniref:Sarcosine dehydrogenase n=1 Tax=hydrothermal vent metagenome TaxID=652676 RepID=A0A3B0TUY4_9ZZZZ
MIPSQARIVIVGAGVIGCAIAYHLARAGARDVLVLEKSRITHGATWHAAGLVGQLRTKRNLTLMMQSSVALMGELGAQTGQETGWRQTGSLRVAASEDRWAELKRTATTARSFGFELELLSASEAQNLFPHMSTDGVAGAAYVPTDGYIDPYSYTMALAAGARANGVTIKEGVQVTALKTAKGRVVAVETDKGPIACETVVNAAGLWARQLGAMAGVDLATGVVEHQYCVTDKSKNFSSELPTFRDPDANFYLKPEVGGFAIGGWEDGAPYVGEKRLPFAFGRELFDGNFDRFENIILPAAERLPVLNEVGIQTLINGPIPVSADGEPLLGPVPGLENFFVACGFTAGIAASGGAGLAMANWILEGDPGMDLWPFDVRRFGPHHGGGRYLADRTPEVYGHYYKIHWPGLEMTTARRLRRSPLYEILKGRGAVYGSKFGWERPNFFHPDSAAQPPQSFGREGWEATVAREHRAIRENVALIDQSSFAKFEVSGPGALAFLQRLAANDLDRPPGRVTYTQMCNEKGGIEADLTITRLEEDRFYIVTGSGFGVRDGGWMRRHMPDDGSVTLSEVTSAYAVINLCGPRSREVLGRAADTEVSNAALPFASARWITIGYAPVLAIRITYVGELGWELHIGTEYAAHVYEALRHAGRDFDIADAGYRAIDSLRLEKRYLYWSADIGPDTSPYEAGLEAFVKMDASDFIGSEALGRIAVTGVTRKLCCFTVQNTKALHGGEAIIHQGRTIGATTSGGYGWTAQKGIALGYVPAELAGQQGFEIDAYGVRHRAERIDGCIYDPARAKIKG